MEREREREGGGISTQSMGLNNSQTTAQFYYVKSE